MKKYIILLAAVALIGCKKEEAKKEGGLGQAIDQVSSLSKIASSADELSKHIEELSKLTPITNDQIKAIFPDVFMGNKRTEYSSGQAAILQVSMGEAKYKNSDGQKSVEIKITDGAGVGSSIVTGIMFTLQSDMEKETETGFEKVTEINGVKMLVKQDTSGETTDSSLKFLYKNRYLIEVDGDYPVDELSRSISEIKLSTLP
ncbi:MULTISPECIES: hypothetical protein [Amniculibacterium]|uniref:hypothetical protein n=1 Tax=Amniculibacterium TaxID=2715289 RepID=UPI000F59303B|nr:MULTISPECIES: hypothetical protein [Amniculibacterium]